MAIRWRNATVHTALLLCAFNIAAMQEQQGSGSTATIPEGDPAQMLTAMKTAMPRVRTPADYDALVLAADKIAAHAQATDEQKKEARTISIQLLYRGTMQNEKEFGPKFEVYTSKIL